MKDFLKKDISTKIGIFLLFCVTLLALFLLVPIDDTAYENNSTIKVDLGYKEDISREGVHENASPDESCRYSDNGEEREILTRSFSEQDIRTFKEIIWVSEADVYEIFPGIKEKASFSCLNLNERGLESFSLKKYGDVWLDEASICIAISSFCGVPPLD